MLIRQSFIAALDLDLIEDGLELADGAHVLPDVEEFLRRVARALFAKGSPVRVDRDVRKMDAARRQNLFRFHHY